ncbi:MAG: class I SAM-dependent methyltransferase [Polyangiales bacterium]
MSEWTAETAEWYAEKYGEYPTNRLTVEHLELAADAVVLDVGCGTASALRHAATKVTRGALIGVDPVPRMVEIARERLVGHPAAERIRLHVAPAHALPLDDASVDVVLALDSYDHWVPHQREGLAEARRVLVPTGRLVVVKDASVPYAAKAKRQFSIALVEAGFRVVEERSTKKADATFTTWVCRVDEAPK